MVNNLSMMCIFGWVILAGIMSEKVKYLLLYWQVYTMIIMITQQVITYTQPYRLNGQLHISKLQNKCYLYFIYIKEPVLFRITFTKLAKLWLAFFIIYINLSNVFKVWNLDIYLKFSGRCFLFLFDILSIHTQCISSSTKTFLTNCT